MNAEQLAKAMYEEAPLDTYRVPWDEADPAYQTGQILAAQRILDKLAGVYQLPDEPAGPLWDKAGFKWVRVKENVWYGGNQDMYLSWGDVVHYYGPLTTTPPTPPIKEGDTGLTAEQVWNLPKGTVIWPEQADHPEPWMRCSDRWVGCTRYVCDAGDLQCAAGDSFRVLILGGDK